MGWADLDEIGRLLLAIDAAPPVEAADVLAAELAKDVGAAEVSFLIADFSGGALVRLGHARSRPGERVGDETAQRVPLRQGSGHERAIRTQRVVVGDNSGPV